MSREVSYDVYVKDGVDSLGRDDYGEAVAHFVERANAVALKRKLVARGEMVRIERSVVHGLSEEEKEKRFSDYYRVPEYELSGESAASQDVVQESPGAPESIVEESERAKPRSWWRRVFGA